MRHTEVLMDGADDPESRPVIDAFVAQGENLAQQVEDFVGRIGVQQALDTPPDSSAPRKVINVTLQFEASIDDAMKALTALVGRYGVSVT